MLTHSLGVFLETVESWKEGAVFYTADIRADQLQKRVYYLSS